jgi:hypothetical protein
MNELRDLLRILNEVEFASEAEGDLFRGQELCHEHSERNQCPWEVDFRGLAALKVAEAESPELAACPGDPAGARSPITSQARGARQRHTGRHDGAAAAATKIR